MVRRESGYHTDENLRRAHATRGSPRVNVGPGERILSGLAGAVLLGVAVTARRDRWLLVPAGTLLLARAWTGHSVFYASLGALAETREHSSTLGSVHGGKGVRIACNVTLHKPVHEVYAFLRDFENLPLVLDHVESVIALDALRSHWIARGPAGLRVCWDVELLNEEENSRIAWHTLPGSDVQHAGSLHLQRLSGGSTMLRLVLSYEPPFGRAVGRLLGKEPGTRIAANLASFKQRVESGELDEQIAACVREPGPE